MKIIKLTAENIKKLVAVEITPKGDVVRITGKNGAGKSSILDAIMWALGGADTIQSKPIREGESKAIVTLDLGDFIVVRRFTETGSYLDVKTKDGAKYPSPQSILDELVGRLSFDPLAFMRMSPAAQTEILRDLTGVDTRELDERFQIVYEERRDINRDGKGAIVVADQAAMKAPEADPGEEKSPQEVLARIQKAQDINTGNAERRREANEANLHVDNLALSVADMQEQLIEARNRVTEARVRLKKTEERVKKARERLVSAEEEAKLAVKVASSTQDVTLDPLRKELAGVEAHNQRTRAWSEFQACTERVRILRDKSGQLSEQLGALTKEKTTLLAGANMPIEGLAFSESTVTYNGIPMEQTSQAEQLRVSLAMAMAMNPKLRVIRITDASLLDSDSMDIVEEMAANEDFQIWLEMVDESGQVGIYIEDGQVAADNTVATTSSPGTKS